MRTGLIISAAALLVAALAVSARGAETVQRFPPPDFDSGYSLPAFHQDPRARARVWEIVDVAALAAALAAAAYFLHARRSRTGVAAVSVASLAYFGFWRGGCVCPIGAIQNVSLGIADAAYHVPWSVMVFFALPLLVALFAGRVFCGGVCPLGAIQDVVLLRPVKISRTVAAALGVIPYVYLGSAVLLAATGTFFVVCRYDPLVPFFRLAGPVHMLVAGGAVLALSTFIGRPYCRWLCPYGALLSIPASVTRRSVTITPDDCIVCGLCKDACPFDAIQAPTAGKEIEP